MRLPRSPKDMECKEVCRSSNLHLMTHVYLLTFLFEIVQLCEIRLSSD